MTTSTLSVVHPRTATGRLAAVMLLIWFSLALYASATNLPAATPWMMPLLVAVPLTIFGLTWYLAPAFRDWAMSLDQRFLILLHTTRTLGLGFVMLYFYSALPPAFAFAAGFGDAAAAVWALLLGAALYRGASLKPGAIYAWNTFGLADFVVAVTLGLASRGAPVGLIVDGANTDPMGLFPLSLIPLFGVPFFIITHLIIYAQLRRN